MKIEFNKVIPNPLLNTEHSADSIWDGQHTFESPKFILVNAPSGRGKSSLVSFMYGIRYDFAGSVKVNGKETKDISLSEWAGLRKDHLSIIFQDMKVFPEMNVKENLLIKNHLTNHKEWSEIQEMADLLGIGDKMEQKAGTLSLGQQQRLVIIRSLLQPFEFLLMDEPFSHIDQENIKLASGLIEKECKANNAGFILTTLGSKYVFNYDEEVQI